MGQFVAIRMIILKPVLETGETVAGFESFMKDELLTAMWNYFSQENRGLEGITFLRGNKHPDAVQSYQPRPPRSGSTPAGANSDYAWITRWASWQDNDNVWKGEKVGRPNGWDDDGDTLGLWNRFRGWCHPNDSRPQHGPSYDSIGAPGYFFYDKQTKRVIKHVGRGAGSLVEGFEVIWERPEPYRLRVYPKNRRLS